MKALVVQPTFGIPSLPSPLPFFSALLTSTLIFSFYISFRGSFRTTATFSTLAQLSLVFLYSVPCSVSAKPTQTLYPVRTGPARRVHAALYTPTAFETQTAGQTAYPPLLSAWPQTGLPVVCCPDGDGNRGREGDGEGDEAGAGAGDGVSVHPNTREMSFPVPRGRTAIGGSFLNPAEVGTGITGMWVWLVEGAGRSQNQVLLLLPSFGQPHGMHLKSQPLACLQSPSEEAPPRPKHCPLGPPQRWLGVGWGSWHRSIPRSSMTDRTQPGVPSPPQARIRHG